MSGKSEDIQEMEKAASKNGDHRRRNGSYLLTGHMMWPSKIIDNRKFKFAL
jgi:hypothetical protein